MPDKFSKKELIGVIIIVIALIGIFIYERTAKVTVPISLVLQVPFSPQAPNDNWNRNEDCEETSITMANAYLTGTTENELPPDAAQESINTLKAWENQHLGYNANTGVDATTAMAEGAFGLKVKQISDYTQQDLKDELAQHHVVLLAINARLLGNPKYLDSGPLYHMIVVRGYENDAFLVNDPGTNGGNSNKYTFAVLKNAAADWNQVAKAMEPQRKIALVLSK